MSNQLPDDGYSVRGFLTFEQIKFEVNGNPMIPPDKETKHE